MAIKEPTPEDIRASYGFVAQLADRVPEIASLLQTAVDQQWTPDRFVMSVTNTNWWKSYGQGARDWMIKEITDPRTAQREAEAGAREMMVMLERAGIPFTLDWERLKGLYIQSKIEQVTPDGMASWLFAAAAQGLTDRQMVSAGGQLGQTINEMFTLAKNYGYSPGDLTGEVLKLTRDMMIGGLAGGTEEWRSKMINYAQSYYAPYAEDIRGGKTVVEIARPIVDRVSALLEVNPDAIDFTDPLMKKALTEWGAENRAYSLREIEDFTRKDARWKTTDNAIESSVKLLQEVGQTFGYLGGGR